MLREEVPCLPLRYEERGTVWGLLGGVAGQGPGVAAIQGSRLVGFLLGALIPAFRGQRSVISPEWANGAELGSSRRIYEEMVARLSAGWMADGCFRHIVALLAHDGEGVDERIAWAQAQREGGTWGERPGGHPCV